MYVQGSKKTSFGSLTTASSVDVRAFYGGSFAFLVLGTAISTLFFEAYTLYSFLIGWFVAIVNLELLKRIGAFVFRIYLSDRPTEDEVRAKLGVGFFVFLKLFALGVIASLLVSLDWLNGMAFVIGTLTILVSGIVFGIREWVYARA